MGTSSIAPGASVLPGAPGSGAGAPGGPETHAPPPTYLEVGDDFEPDDSDYQDMVVRDPVYCECPPPPGDTCHCQAGRFLIICGGFSSSAKNVLTDKDTDPDIKVILVWAARLNGNHLHKAAFPGFGRQAVSFNKPFFPKMKPAQAGAAAEVDTDNHWVPSGPLGPGVSTPAQVTAALGQSWNDCCYFEEVLVIMHGDQSATELIAGLPNLLSNKAVKKLVLWACKSGKKFRPSEQLYQNLAYIARPKQCPCECKPGCNNRDSDKCAGQDPQCPHGEPTKIIMAGSANVFGVDVPVSVGIDHTDANSPFMSPDGTAREITVDAAGNITAKLGEKKDGTAGGQPQAGPATSMFMCKTLKAQPRLLDEYNKYKPVEGDVQKNQEVKESLQKAGLTKDQYTKKDKVKPVKDGVYTGPKVNTCTDGTQGCFKVDTKGE